MPTKNKTFNVAILGATGAVGEAMLSILEERGFPVNNLYPLASRRSVGKTVTFNEQSLDVIDVDTFDFSLADIGLFFFFLRCLLSMRLKPPLPVAWLSIIRLIFVMSRTCR